MQYNTQCLGFFSVANIAVLIVRKYYQKAKETRWKKEKEKREDKNIL